MQPSPKAADRYDLVVAVARHADRRSSVSVAPIEQATKLKKRLATKAGATFMATVSFHCIAVTDT